MKNRRSHIGQFSQFPVSDRIDWLGIVNDPGICHQKAGHIGPVLIEIRVNSSRHDRTGNVRAASGKGLDRPVFLCPVKSRNHCAVQISQFLGDQFFCDLSVKLAVSVEADHLCRIYKGKSQISRHDLSI